MCWLKWDAIMRRHCQWRGQKLGGWSEKRNWMPRVTAMQWYLSVQGGEAGQIALIAGRVKPEIL